MNEEDDPKFKQFMLDATSIQGFLSSLIGYENDMNAELKRLRAGEPYRLECVVIAISGNSNACYAKSIYPENPEIVQRADRVIRLCSKIRAYEKPQ